MHLHRIKEYLSLKPKGKPNSISPYCPFTANLEELMYVTRT